MTVTQEGNGKSLGQIGADLDYPIWGPNVDDIRVIALSDLRSDVAPSRRASAELEHAKVLEQQNPIIRAFTGLREAFSTGIALTGALILVAVLYFTGKLRT